MKKKREQAVALLLSFAVPGLVMLWAYASLGIAPFGDRTVLVSDMSSQYVDFFCALKNGDLFFSWSKALGTGYIGVFSYYVSSPLSLLTLFVPNEAMPVGLALLTVLKIALAGLSFCVFAQRRFPDCGAAAPVCAVCYGLMSYNAAYAMCIMWLDGVIWLPLILLALERILAGRGAGPFIAALTVCFLSTWYISYMIGLFCVLYLCARLAAVGLRWEELKRVLARFFGGAACALCLTAWLWLPTFLAMFTGKFQGGNSAAYSDMVLCDPLRLAAQLLPGQYGGIDYSAMPYVCCTISAVLLAAAYFISRRFGWREKLANGAVLVILFLSMVFAPLDKAWHLFQRPNWFPFRYAFVFSFFLLYLTVQTLASALGALEGKRGCGLQRGAALALAAFMTAGLGFNARGLLSGVQKQYGSDSYQGYRDGYTAGAQLVSAAETDSGGGFFRMGATEDRGLNSPLAFGYPGITHYSSLYHYDLNCLLKNLGFAQSWYWCAYYGSTPLTDALFGIQYVISKDDMPFGYNPIAQAGDLTLWKTPDVLPVAFYPETVGETLLGGTPFDRQNNVFSCLSGVDEPVFSRMPAEVAAESGETVFSTVGTGKPLYMDLSAGGLGEVLVNGEHLLSLGASETASVHYVGTPAPGQMWTVTVRHTPGWTGQLWELDQNVLHSAVAGLDKAEGVSVDKNGRVRLTVQLDKGRALVATIPAEDGWAAYVDGRRVETRTWLGTFLLVDIPAGAHEVELRYTAPGLVPGIALGVLGAAGLVLTNTRGYIGKSKYRKKRGRPL